MKKTLDWRLVLYLSLFGPAIGGLMVLGVFPEGGERLAWLVATAACAVVIARRTEAPVRHGAVVGFLSGATSTLVQAVFSATLLSNNPWMVERFADMPEGFDLQFFIFMLVPFIGVASALALALVSMLAAKAVRRR
ncbi:MAG: hypothetical protein OEO21_02030 [Candidatus Krumholzibacteria bacterium]|nr:hypothetical protein [Candidatus Krumholzibacteria bacterium]